MEAFRNNIKGLTSRGITPEVYAEYGAKNPSDVNILNGLLNNGFSESSIKTLNGYKISLEDIKTKNYTPKRADLASRICDMTESFRQEMLSKYSKRFRVQCTTASETGPVG